MQGGAYAASLSENLRRRTGRFRNNASPYAGPAFRSKNLTGEWSRRVTKWGFSPEWKACGLRALSPCSPGSPDKAGILNGLERLDIFRHMERLRVSTPDQGPAQRDGLNPSFPAVQGDAENSARMRDIQLLCARVKFFRFLEKNSSRIFTQGRAMNTLSPFPELQAMLTHCQHTLTLARY